jgi:hypothetical protein
MRILIAACLLALVILPVVALGMARANYAPPAADAPAPKKSSDTTAPAKETTAVPAKKYSRSGYDVTPLPRAKVEARARESAS